MCTYNGASYIREQIQSILNQTYPIFEFLIFDDNSTDETVSVIQQMQQQYPVIQLYENEKNLGYNINFAQGLQQATGDVIAIADQDDIWIDRKLEQLIKAWDFRYPVIYCYSITFSENQIPSTLKISSIFRKFKGTDGRKIFLRNTVSGHALLVKRSLIPLLLPFEKDIYYDWWLTIVAAYNGGVQYLEEALVLHRHHGCNASRNNNLTRKQSIQKDKEMVLLNAPKFIQTPGIPEKHRQLMQKFKTLIKESSGVSFYFPLFVFMIRHRHLFFSYKKGGLLLISHIKHSFRFAVQTKMDK